MMPTGPTIIPTPKTTMISMRKITNTQRFFPTRTTGRINYHNLFIWLAFTKNDIQTNWTRATFLCAQGRPLISRSANGELLRTRASPMSHWGPSHNHVRRSARRSKFSIEWLIHVLYTKVIIDTLNQKASICTWRSRWVTRPKLKWAVLNSGVPEYPELRVRSIVCIIAW